MRTQMMVAGSSQANGQGDELAEWLAQPPVPTEDPLCWWLANRKLYPRLSRMAIDIHSTPGKCVSSAAYVADSVDIQLRLLMSSALLAVVVSLSATSEIAFVRLPFEH